MNLEAPHRYIIDANILVGGEDSLPTATNHIVLGDCLDVLRKLPDESVQLIHTSPPYNIDKEYRADFRDRRHIASYGDFLAAVIYEMRRVLGPNGSLFWQTGYTDAPGGVEGDILPIDHLSYGFFREKPNPLILWDRIIWRYLGGMAFKRKFTNRHETILWWVKPSGATAQPTFDVDAVRERSRELDKRNAFWGKNPGNVWEVDRVAFGSTEATSHIAVYPDEISEKIIRACSRPGDLVLDPFSGSGTTPKAARSLARRWLGIELSPVYAQESASRIGFQQPNEVMSLASHLTKKRVFGGQRAVRTRREILEGLSEWVPELDLHARRIEYEALLSEVFPNGPAGSEVKAAKPDVWSRFEAILNGDPSDPIVEVDGLLAIDYRNRRNLNGAHRFRTALEVAEELVRQLQAPQAPAFVGEMLLNEPSSYLIEQDRVHLLQTQKLSKNVADGWDDFMDGIRQEVAAHPTEAHLRAWAAFTGRFAAASLSEDGYRDLLDQQSMFGESRLLADRLNSSFFWWVLSEVERAFGSPSRLGSRQVFELVARAIGELAGESGVPVDVVPG